MSLPHTAPVAPRDGSSANAMVTIHPKASGSQKGITIEVQHEVLLVGAGMAGCAGEVAGVVDDDAGRPTSSYSLVGTWLQGNFLVNDPLVQSTSYCPHALAMFQKDLPFSVPSNTREREKTQLLSKVSGFFEPGQMTALARLATAWGLKGF